MMSRRSRYANCEFCEYFKPYNELSEELQEKAWIWCHYNRPGSRPLGWCFAYNRPVTYLTGTCYRFKKKVVPCRKITEFMGLGEPRG